MGTLYRPIDKRVGSKYTIVPHSKATREQVQHYVEQMTLEQFNGALLFFSTLLNELSNISLDYLENEVKKLTTELTEQLKTETT
jgi:retron-type reverse transcriptase